MLEIEYLNKQHNCKYIKNLFSFIEPFSKVRLFNALYIE